MIRWCGRHDVGYVIGVARNARLQKAVADWEAELEVDFAKTQSKQRMIREFRYAAQSWLHERQLVTRLEFGSQSRNPRFVVTHLDVPPESLYDDLYCQRGEAENRIKETQLDLFGPRQLPYLPGQLAAAVARRFGLCPDATSTQYRALAGTDLANAQAATIRVKLLKIGASVIRSRRRIRILLASHHPERELFLSASRALAGGGLPCGSGR